MADGIMFTKAFATLTIISGMSHPAAAHLITAEPERHHICEVALGMIDGQESMGEYYCERDNHELDILGASDKKIDCKLPKMPAQTLTFFDGRSEQWSVHCTEADRIKSAE